MVAELEIFRCLMSYAVGSGIRLPWQAEVLVTDACPTGYAGCSTEARVEEVAAVGRADRWRFTEELENIDHLGRQRWIHP